MVVSLMADNDRESWHELIKKVEDTGAHGLELNFGCPHGMTERGMGAAVGQDPEIARMVVEWVMEKATIPVITKLTPNVHSVVPTGKAVVEAGTNALSLINTIQSVTGIDLDTLVPNPYVAGKSVFGGYCGPAVKPIALKMLTTIAQDPTNLESAHFRYWRHQHLERCCGIYAAGRYNCAGMYGRYETWLQDHRRSVRRAE